MSWNWGFVARNKSEAKALVAKRSTTVGQTYQAPQLVFDAINGALDAMGNAENPIEIRTDGHIGSSEHDISSCKIHIQQLYIEKP